MTLDAIVDAIGIEPYNRTEYGVLYCADCLDILPKIPDKSVDLVLTDPPYEIGFMGKSWDASGIAYNVDMWRFCLDALKPGGYLVAFSGTRTYHRMACAIEDAGFEIRDMIEWVYGSGFPKSHNIGKAVDKLQGNEREVVGKKETKDFSHHKGSMMGKETTINNKTQTTTITDTKGTSEYEGWGTALKPAHEPICVARKPLSEKTVAENCLKWGTGGINIDESRIPCSDKTKFPVGDYGESNFRNNERHEDNSPTGRFPANLIHDGSEEVRECFPESKSVGASPAKSNGTTTVFNGGNKHLTGQRNEYDSGNASRFFKSIIYQAKASKSERNKGCEGLGTTRHADRNMDDGVGGDNPRNRTNTSKQNFHPTVKPIALMEYLAKMFSREGAIVLDPFCGSGSTACAAKNTNRNFIGVELSPEYAEISKHRMGVERLKQEELFSATA